MQTNQQYDLVKVVAHDLKSPIGAVKGYVDLLSHVGPLNERQQHFAARAIEGLTYMEHLIANLMEFARLGTMNKLEFMECDLQVLARDALDLLEGHMLKRNLTLRFDTNSATSTVMGDQRLLGQVMNNLLSNAVKYNRDSGEIGISIDREHDFVRVQVSDTGMGISADDLPHIFDQFYRAPSSVENQIEGTGLGLAIVKMIVEQHKGEISVVSELGQGTIFTVLLPRHVRSGESDERYYDLSAHPTDRVEGMGMHYAETASEESDSVDDSIQESSESTESDSRSDDR
ncbi:MAG: HAMP domain-containing sensor histidine kinase [Anaerolineae bacterium]